MKLVVKNDFQLFQFNGCRSEIEHDSFANNNVKFIPIKMNIMATRKEIEKFLIIKI